MNSLFQDLRYGLRMLGKNPGFTAVAVMTLALGIGANTAVFSVVHGVLLRPLPFPEQERLVTLLQAEAGSGNRLPATPANFLDWRERSSTFEHLAAVMAFTYDALAPDGTPETYHAVQVSSGFFEALSVQPHLGRTFLPEEFQEGRERAVVLSYGLWQERFGSDPAIVGRSLVLNGDPYSVVGVLPRGFDTPLYPGRKIYAPLVFWEQMRQQRRANYLGVVGRLRAGTAIEQARAEMAAIGRQLTEEHPRENSGISVAVLPLHQHIVGSIERQLWILYGAVALVLLIACANVSNLLLARATVRQKELAICAALGATRGRLLRKLLAESALLAAAGALAGLLLARWALDALQSFGAAIPRLDQIGLHPPVLAFSAGLALTAILLAGLPPALQATRTQRRGALQESGRTATASRSRERYRGALVGAQVALALILLAGAGLLLRSFAGLMAVSPGFAAENLVALQVFVWSRYPDPAGRQQYFRQATESLRSVPGVRAAAAGTAFPFLPSGVENSYPIEPVGQPSLAGAERAAVAAVVTPEYFAALGVPLLRGRQFDEFDGSGRSEVAVINQAMARRFWPDEDPMGQSFRVQYFGPRQLEVVGVVADVQLTRLDQEASPAFFLPHAQLPTGSMIFTVRTDGDPRGLLPAIQQAIWQVNPEQPFYVVRTGEELLARSVAQRRFAVIALGAFALLAVVLAGVGIYGVVGQITAQRTHEIGIRVALGATRRNILQMVLGRGMRFVGAGLLVGLAGALAATRVLASQLYSVQPHDPATFIAVMLLLGLVALFACWLPARRATRVDPMAALRNE